MMREEDLVSYSSTEDNLLRTRREGSTFFTNPPPVEVPAKLSFLPQLRLIDPPGFVAEEAVC